MTRKEIFKQLRKKNIDKVTVSYYADNVRCSVVNLVAVNNRHTHGYAGYTLGYEDLYFSIIRPVRERYQKKEGQYDDWGELIWDVLNETVYFKIHSRIMSTKHFKEIL